MNIFRQTIQLLLTVLKYHSHQTNYHWSLLLLIQFHLYPDEILSAVLRFLKNEVKLFFDLQTQIHDLGFILELFYWLDSYCFRLEFHLYDQCQKHHLIIISSFLFFFRLNLFDHCIFLAMVFQSHHINFWLFLLLKRLKEGTADVIWFNCCVNFCLAHFIGLDSFLDWIRTSS